LYHNLEAICDTSFLIGLIEYKAFEKLLERFRPVKLYIPESVYRELSSLLRSRKGLKSKISPLLNLINRYRDIFIVIPSERDEPDIDVLVLASKMGLVVATLDRNVRVRAWEMGLRVLFFRDGEPYIN